MARLVSWALALCAVLLITPSQAAPGDRARLLEGAAAAKLTPAELAEEPPGYLAPGSLDLKAILSPPPQPGSAQDEADLIAVKNASLSGAARWTRAQADDASVYDRFDKEFGLSIDRRHLPRLVALLNRASTDILTLSGEAKKLHPRPRPFQRLALTRVCGQPSAPKPEAAPTTGTSYPSGHAALGWAAALVMIEVAPTRAQQIAMRAVDYAESRVVCGVHFPTDVEASRVLAAAAVDRLLALPEFRAAVACAKAERRAVQAGEKSENLPACP
jgi:acid phosphatase (class A)